MKKFVLSFASAVLFLLPGMGSAIAEESFFNQGLAISPTIRLKSQSFEAANLSSGVYFYRIKTETFSDVKKLLLIK